MVALPSKLFPGFQCEDGNGAFFEGTAPGYGHSISLYLSEETVADSAALQKAGSFFDGLGWWDSLCRELFVQAPPDSDDGTCIASYFSFYLDELPQLFEGQPRETLTLAHLASRLRLAHMASHGSSSSQYFVVDFTLGYDQLLCVYLNSSGTPNRIVWES